MRRGPLANGGRRCGRGEGMDGILDRIERVSAGLGFSLDDTVRTRLWARDRESRNLGSQARSRRMSGKARSASSSYIAAAHLDSGASVALDFLAMRSDGEKKLVEYDPPIVPLRYLDLEGRVFLSGVTSTTGDLAQQVSEILRSDRRGPWNTPGPHGRQVVRVVVLSASRGDPTALKAGVSAGREGARGSTEVLVRGRAYSAFGKLIEIDGHRPR